MVLGRQKPCKLCGGYVTSTLVTSVQGTLVYFPHRWSTDHCDFITVMLANIAASGGAPPSTTVRSRLGFSDSQLLYQPRIYLTASVPKPHAWRVMLQRDQVCTHAVRRFASTRTHAQPNCHNHNFAKVILQASTSSCQLLLQHLLHKIYEALTVPRPTPSTTCLLYTSPSPRD